MSMPPHQLDSQVTPEIQPVVRVGLIYSSTGPLAATEISIRQGAIVALEEIATQRVAGDTWIEIVDGDYASDPTTAGRCARELLRDGHVDVLVGGYTSASRVSIIPAVDHVKGVYIYPTYFEGLESHPRTVYTGAVPNQFFEAYLNWIVTNLGSRIYVIGSDYVYPRTLGVMTQNLARAAGADIVADRYVPLGSANLDHIVAEIRELQPDVVISNLVGVDSVRPLYRGLRAAGLGPDDVPVAATVTTEIEVREIGPEFVEGHYMASTYFNSLENPENVHYVAALKARFGDDAVAHVAQVGAYNALWVLADGLRRAKGATPDAILKGLVGATFAGNPEGWPLVIGSNHFSSHSSYIGRAQADGSYRVIEEFGPSDPDPYPPTIVPSARRPSLT